MPPKLPIAKSPKCPVMRAFKPSGETTLIRCKQWTCPHCQRVLARKWARRTYKELETITKRIEVNGWSGVAAFITFTLPPNVRNAQDGYRMLPRLWNAFRMRMRRAYGANWSYIAFVEGQQQTRQGMPHFHIISTKPIPVEPSKKGYTAKRRMSEFAVTLGFGFRFDQKIMHNKGVASYVSKYASKQDASIPKNFKRVRASHDWYKEPKKERKPFLVPAKGEDLAHFIDRVHMETGVLHELLANRWLDAATDLSNAQK